MPLARGQSTLHIYIERKPPEDRFSRGHEARRSRSTPGQRSCIALPRLHLFVMVIEVRGAQMAVSSAMLATAVVALLFSSMALSDD